MPAWLIDLQRMKIAGIRLVNIEFHRIEIETLKQITKTRDHESHSIAQAIIRNFA